MSLLRDSMFSLLLPSRIQVWSLVSELTSHKFKKIIITIRETDCGVRGNSLYYVLNFYVKLKLF